MQGVGSTGWAVSLLDTEDRKSRSLPLTPPLHPALGAIVGTSRAIEDVRVLVREYAPCDATVLIQGESGTGKELVARALHALSPRARGRFVAVNCAAIPESLLEGELFGHVRGSFTGAVRDHCGLLGAAHGGTLFLDEIAELAPPLQAKLLRALDSGAYRRVGAALEEKADVRIVAATHRDLARLAHEDRFRADLYYRLAVLEIYVPPLRARPDDIPLLVRRFLERCRPGRTFEVTREALEQLVAAPWPGNVRELENAVLRTALRCRSGVIDRFEMLRSRQAVVDPPAREIPLEKFTALLAEHRGRLGPVARALGVSVRSVQRYVARYRISRRSYAGVCG